MKIKCLWFSLVVVNIFGAPVPAQEDPRARELVGAKSILEQVASGAMLEADASLNISTKIVEFQEQSLTMPPKEAAERWLQLYEAWIVARKERPRRAKNVDFSSFIAALPPPKAWGDLKRIVQQREFPADRTPLVRHCILRLLVARLTEPELVPEEVKTLESVLDEKDEPEEGEAEDEVPEDDDFEWVRSNMLSSMRDLELEVRPERGLTFFLASLEEGDEDMGWMGSEETSVPDLLLWTNREEAKNIIKKALLSDLDLSFSAESTIELARQLCSELKEELFEAQWDLCFAADQTELFEQFLEIAPGPDDYDYERMEAQGWYVQGLLGQGRIKEANAFLLKLHSSESGYSDDSVQYVGECLARPAASVDEQRANFDFVVQFLSSNPEAYLWDCASQLALRVRESSRLLELLDATLGNDIPEEIRLWLVQIRSELHLALGNTELGTKGLRELLVRLRRKDEDRYQWFEIAIDLARIGMLTENKISTELGVRTASSLVQQDEDIAIFPLYQLLIDLNRYDAAESLVSHSLALKVAEMDDLENDYLYSGASAGLLILLADVYDRAGRREDVMELLEHGPWWLVEDLSELMYAYDADYAAMDELRELPNFPAIAARALVHANRVEEAIQACRLAIERQPGADATWELLEQHDPEFESFALQQVDENPFEERPLIWLGAHYLVQEKLERAEEVLRRAIQIDPSDGEQGPNHRLRAYQILGDVLEAKGDVAGAAFHRRAVAAVRKAEEADAYLAAGLQMQALSRYEAAAADFGDAYCIHSRLAIQSVQVGDFENAQEHFQRAFEMMPASFGRVESHCLGCEGVFDSAQAQDVALEVFTELVQEDAKNPQVQYLLGFLQDTRMETEQAVEHYRAAVELDPMYLNAWLELLNHKEYIHDSAEVDEIVATVVRLDPFQRVSYVDLDDIYSMEKLWHLWEEHKKLTAEGPAPFFPLPASVEYLKKLEERDVDLEMDGYFESSDLYPFHYHDAMLAIGYLHDYADYLPE